MVFFNHRTIINKRTLLKIEFLHIENNNLAKKIPVKKHHFIKFCDFILLWLQTVVDGGRVESLLEATGASTEVTIASTISWVSIEMLMS